MGHLQDQVDSLPSVILQKHRGLDLLTASQGSICALLQEQCSFYTSNFGLIRSGAKLLHEKASKLLEGSSNNPLPLPLYWPLPLLAPLAFINIILLFLPCLSNPFQRLL